MVQSPTVYVKLAQLEYYAGDQVSDLIIWCEESCEWEEGALQSSIWDTEFQSKLRQRCSALVAKENVNTLKYQGNHVNYICRLLIWDSENKPVAAGNYIIPFGFNVPANATASCHFKGDGWKINVQHQCFVALREAFSTTKQIETKKMFLKPIMDDLLSRTDHDLLGATNLISFVVLEKPLYQATLKSYIFQCSYTIGFLFFEKTQLTLTIKKNSQAFLPGEIVPIIVEIVNQTRNNIFSIFVTLRNIITLKSSAGIYKEIVHPICRLAQPLNVAGHQAETCEQIYIPFPLPIGIAPTCHGSTVTNEWDFLISCNYKRNYGINMKYTEQDLNVPVCIWPTTVNPSKTVSNITRNCFFNNNIELSDKSSDTSPSQVSLLPVLTKDTPVTLLPTQVFKVDYDVPTPKVENVIRLASSKLNTDPSKELLQTLPLLNVFFQYELCHDSGAILSQELQNSFEIKNVKQSRKIKLMSKKKAIPCATRVVTPMQE
ncbi:uncharacterized protein LOC128883238 isoform X2 [Hylaeus volcanicus]|uniref:uncharacterized protein LOC128883238 isoform X2 n=1 Tax=Hylaeus volcanicus TaxID=313075 RepID=UPI0023B78E23|nr:uncharacterized protein LOC128883238 isoform X2 [Hylaeus volcanicus]